MNARRTLLLLVLILLAALPVRAQPFGAGPPGTTVGSSMANAPLRGLPQSTAPRVRNAPVFGDTVEERTYGRDFDDSYLKPEVRRPAAMAGDPERAYRGRSRLDPARAGAFARSGPTAIGSSPVTRPALGARRR